MRRTIREATTGITTYRGAIYPWHCDHMGHMNVMWYSGKFDEANWNVLLEIGLAPSWLRSNQRGMAALKQSFEYLRELRAGDLIEIRGSVTGMGEKVLTITQTMTNSEDGSAVASLETLAVHLDTELRKAVALPQHAVAAIRRRFPGVTAMARK